MVSYEKVLPIGTVVLLEGASRRLMIIGYQRRSSDQENEEIYDYCGCPYPQGYISPQSTAIFNHDRIRRIYAMGLQNDEEIMFEEKLRKLIAEREEGSVGEGEAPQN